MWVPKTPKRADFCGCPPCHLCYCWNDEQELEVSLRQMTTELLGRPATNDAELEEARKIGEHIHYGVFAQRAIEEMDKPGGMAVGDIGMTPIRRLEGQLGQRRKPLPLPKLTIDELVDRNPEMVQAVEEAAEAARIEKAAKEAYLKGAVVLPSGTYVTTATAGADTKWVTLPNGQSIQIY